MRKKAPRRISVEALLLWTYRDQRAADEASGADGAGWQCRSGDGVAALMDRARLGCRIDGGSGKTTATPRLHPDAEMVDAWVRALGDDVARLVIRHAAVGLRPEVPPPSKLEPLRWGVDGMGESAPTPKELLGPPSVWVRENGRFVRMPGHVGDGVMRYRRPWKGGGCYEAQTRWTPIGWRPSSGRVAARRAIYGAWWEALAALRELLADAPLRERILTMDLPLLASAMEI